MRQVSSFCWRASNDMTDAVLEDLLPDLDQDINELLESSWKHSLPELCYWNTTDI